MTAALQIEGLSHRFGPLRALDDVSLTVGQGRFTALLGVNGAGKTTLFSLITRLYDSRSGRIVICGHDLRRTPGQALAEIGVVFQSRAMDLDLTVAQNLAYHGALHGMGRKQLTARIAAVIAQVGLQDKLQARVATLSGGQSRRAEIARALMHEPKLLLLDEASVGLDIQARSDVLALVRALVAEAGVGVLWATHLLDEIAPEDDTVILHRGRVLAAGTAREIASTRTLSEVFLDMTATPETAP
ncbi:MAG: ATP-binding cassette domain-containing protein [Rhodobacteraceae bacterium]|nr:MAG: ATP-binding cassette domain-containing protein [Paracoccaceae bacterium]